MKEELNELKEIGLDFEVEEKRHLTTLRHNAIEVIIARPEKANPENTEKLVLTVTNLGFIEAEQKVKLEFRVANQSRTVLYKEIILVDSLVQVANNAGQFIKGQKEKDTTILHSWVEAVKEKPAEDNAEWLKGIIERNNIRVPLEDLAMIQKQEHIF